MLSFVARSFVAAALQPDAIFTVAVKGRVVGLVVCTEGTRRLTWLSGADPMLVGADVPSGGDLDGDLDAWAAALSRRIGRVVEIGSLPG